MGGYLGIFQNNKEAGTSFLEIYHFLLFPKFVGNEKNLKPKEYPIHVCYGDGEEIEDEVMDHLRVTMWNNLMSLKLKEGDVIVLDNLLCQHTRMDFKGERRMLIHLAEQISYF